jgi:hypothetical protein
VPEGASAACPQTTSTSNPAAREFYTGDIWLQTPEPQFHSEVTIGALAMLRGSKNVVVNAFDPIEGDPNYDAGGVRWLNNITGSYDRAVEIYRGVDSTSGGAFGKSIGLGDIELMCDPAPLQIGNRLWNDQNSDGTQDPGEPGLSGALVQLVYNGVVLSTTTTASDGTYYFNLGAISSTLANISHGVVVVPLTTTLPASTW